MGKRKSVRQQVLEQLAAGGAKVTMHADGHAVVHVQAGDEAMAGARNVRLGHNSEINPSTAGQLKAIIERIENLEEEKRQIGADIKDVYGEAKANGFDAKTIRKIVALRRIDDSERQEQSALLETYLHALGME